MALTLLEAAKLLFDKGQVLRASVITMFAQQSDLLAAIPFKDVPGMSWAYNREGALPGVAFRGVNESYTASTGVINPLVEALRIAGGDLDFDTFYAKRGDIRSTHENMKVKALTAELTRVLVKGDSTSQPREFDGLQARITGSQLIKAKASGTDGGDPLSLAKLDELIDAVPGCTHLLMSKAMRRLITAASRLQTVGGQVEYDKNAFGRRITKYNDVPILVPYEDNGGTEPIAFDELGSTGATATATSIYGLVLGDGMCTGLQNGPMDVRDLGELNTTPAFRTRVEWFVGLCVEHGRAAARLYGISNAAVIA